MLEPYRVIEVAGFGTAMCGQMLADLGADVVVVEPPGGAEMRRRPPFYEDVPDPNRSLTWWAYNRNKRGITLDLEQPDGRASLRRLAAQADFVVEGLPPGRMAALGLGYDDLAAANPRLIGVSTSPFGQNGPKAGYEASDLTIVAASSLLSMTGDADRPPLRISVPQAHLHCGAEAAATALIAHYHREQTGRGQHLDVSAQQAVTMATQCYILAAPWQDERAYVSRVAGGAKAGPLFLKLVFPCKDGFVSCTFYFGNVIGVFTNKLMQLVHKAGFADASLAAKDYRPYATLLMTGQEPASELPRAYAAVTAFLMTKTKAELFDLGREHGLLLGPASTIDDIVASPQLAARSFWVEVEHPELQRSFLYPGPFVKASESPLNYRRRAPLLGEHNREVSSEWSVVSGDRPATPATTHHSPLTTHAPALAGVKVLDFTWVMAGPATTRYLADYGATVVKVESATHIETGRTLQPFWQGNPDPERSAFMADNNAGKLGMTLNLGNEQGRAIARRLVAWADVVTESFTPKVMRAWGMDYEALRAINPGIIMLSTSLNGMTGPYAQVAGFGTLGAALAGFTGFVQWPDRAPAGPFSAYTDYVSPKFGVAALLAALDERRRTGKGQHLDQSQAESSIHFLGPAVLEYTANGRKPLPAGNSDPVACPHGVYPAAGDDRWVAIAVETAAQWAALAATIGEPLATDKRFATPSGRREHEAALDELIGGWTAQRSPDESERTLQAAGVPAAEVVTIAGAFAEPQLQARGHFVEVSHDVLGSSWVESSRTKMSATPASVTAAGPSLGQHTDYVLRELLGMDDEAIIEAVADGAIE
ncbi:MAG: CaiB/BaiF CoA transferase family protein [Dehalococcoidia bacterium]